MRFSPCRAGNAPETGAGGSSRGTHRASAARERSRAWPRPRAQRGRRRRQTSSVFCWCSPENEDAMAWPSAFTRRSAASSRERRAAVNRPSRRSVDASVSSETVDRRTAEISGGEKLSNSRKIFFLARAASPRQTGAKRRCQRARSPSDVARDGGGRPSAHARTDVSDPAPRYLGSARSRSNDEGRCSVRRAVTSARITDRFRSARRRAA